MANTEEEFMLEDWDYLNFQMTVLEKVLNMLEMARTSQSYKEFGECTINIMCGKYCLHSTFLLEKEEENCHSEEKEEQSDGTTEKKSSWKKHKREDRRKCSAIEKAYHKTSSSYLCKKAKYKTRIWRLKMLKNCVKGGNIANVLFYAWFLLNRKRREPKTSAEIEGASVSNTKTSTTVEESKQGKELENVNFHSQEELVNRKRQMEEVDLESSVTQEIEQVIQHQEEELRAGGDAVTNEETVKSGEESYEVNNVEEEKPGELGDVVKNDDERGHMFQKKEEEEPDGKDDKIKTEGNETSNLKSEKENDDKEKKNAVEECVMPENTKEITRIQEEACEKLAEKPTIIESSEQLLKRNGDEQIYHVREHIQQITGREMSELEDHRLEGESEGKFENHDSWNPSRKRRIRGWFRKKWRNLRKAFTNSKNTTSETN